jgi:hypothetical protein
MEVMASAAKKSGARRRRLFAGIIKEVAAMMGEMGRVVDVRRGDQFG